MSKQFGILKFKSKTMKYSYRISEYNAAMILQYIAEVEHEPATTRQRSADGKFLPIEEEPHDN